MYCNIITYDLNKYKDYNSLYEALKKLGAKRVQDSVWILEPYKDSDFLYNTLQQYCDHDDDLLIALANKSSIRSTKSTYVATLADALKKPSTPINPLYRNIAIALANQS